MVIQRLGFRETKKKIKGFNISSKRIKRILPIVLVLSLLFLLINPNSELQKSFAYTVIVDNPVDADSNVDSSANVGDDGATSYTDAQSQDSTDQIIVESDEGGSGMPLSKLRIAGTTSSPDLLSISHYEEGLAYAYDGSVIRGIETYKDYSGTWRSNDNWNSDITNISRIEEVESSYNETSDDYDEYEFIEEYVALSGNFKVIFQETKTRIIGDGWEFTQRPNRVFLYNWETEAIVGSQDVAFPSSWGYNSDTQRIRYDDIFTNMDLFFGYNGSDLKEVFRASTLPENYPSSPWDLADSYLVIDTLITNQSGFNMADDNGDITDNTTVVGRLKLLDQYDQIKAFMPMGTAWAWFDETQSNQTVDIRSRLLNINGEWHLYSAIEYELFNHALRDGDVFIDPTWTIGDQSGDSWSECEFVQTMENTTTNYAQLYPSNTTGNITSPINQAYVKWVRISYQGDNNSQTVDIYWNSSSDNGITDPFVMSLVQSDASPNTDYYFSQEKQYGGWRFVLTTDNVSESPILYNITVNNDGAIVNTGSAVNSDSSGTAFSCDVSGLTINEGDVVIAMMHQNDDLEDFTDNNGIYPFTEAYQDDGQDTHHYGIFYRVAGASEPSSYAFTSPNNDDWTLIIRVFEGVNTTDIFDVTPSGSTENSYADYSSGTTLTIDEITITKAGSVGIIICFSDTGQTNVYSNPTNGYGNYTGGTGNGWPMGSFLKIHTSGVTGSTEVTQTKNQDWTVNHFALKVADVVSVNYKLDWEHQVTSVDTDKNYHVLTVYGQATGTDSETFSMYLWNASDTTWYDTSQDISTSETWFNWTITSAFSGCISSSMTVRYIGNTETDDTTESTLNIDYMGIRSYNFSIYGLASTHNSLEFSPDNNYHAFTDSPLSFQVESGMTYNIQVKGVDITGTPVNSGFLYFNTVDNSGTSTQLTTSYQNLYTSQSVGNNTHTIYLWVNYGWTSGGSGITDGIRSYTLNVTIIPV